VLPGHRAAEQAGKQWGYVLGLDAGVSNLWTPKEHLTVQEFKGKEFQCGQLSSSGKHSHKLSSGPLQIFAL